MWPVHSHTLRQISNGAGHPQDTVKPTRRQGLLFNRQFQQLAG